jgi:serine/threonine protein kinase
MKDLLLQNCRLDGRFDIRERLGRGSYAEIFIAEDTLASPESPHKTVVIKALNVFMQNDLDLDLERTLVENFQNEAIALDRVRHPNIISRLGHGTAQDLRGTVFHYLVLEYLSGGDLARYCRDKSLSLLEALSFLEQVSAGLGNAHQNDVIHRDIKPQNLLLTKDHRIVKIADFGVARVTLSDAPITRVGTNIYAPPEHSPMLAGNTGNLTFSELTPAADVYSLAKTAYVLITGESPRFFANQPVTELPHAMRHKPWAESLVEILNQATQNDPRRRFQTVNDFWKELSGLKVSADTQDIKPHTRITTRLNPIPQAQIAVGFSPYAPVKAEFNTSRELKLKEVVSEKAKNPMVVEIPRHKNFPPAMPPNGTVAKPPVNEQIQPVPEPENPSPPKRKRKWPRILAAFVIFVGLFAGSLYATYNYLLGRGFLPAFGSVSQQQTGVATTDVNLRSVPTSLNNEPIGLVTKDSKVRIYRIDDNWYEIEVVTHGRPKSNPSAPDRGWAYGRYIKIDE